MIDIAISKERQPKTLFVTGTDTDAGKTVATKAILDSWRQQNLATLAMKPVASGCEWHNQWVNSDALIHRQAMTMDCPYSLSNPYAFEPAIAPHIAAQEAGVEIKLEHLLESYQQLCQLAPDRIVIEGAGGWQLPLSAQLMMPEFVQALNAAKSVNENTEVVIVVGLKLGCLNHAMLTEQAIKACGLKVAGWIGCHSSPEPMPYLAANLTTLEQCLEAPKLGIIEHTLNWQNSDLSCALKGL